jgi:hypothetical protein
MRGLTIVKIIHGVAGALGAFHVFFGFMVGLVFENTGPSSPNPVTGQIVRWEYTRSNNFGGYSATYVVYITQADYAKWRAFNEVGVALLLVCGLLYLYLKWVAEREGRTSIY